MSTGIEWTDETWNPVTGCDKVSPGCDHCYAETIAHRFAGTKAYPDGFKVTLHPERLDQPIRWKRPRMIFVNSMSDLFHKDIPDEYIAQVWATMALAHRHTFQVLTKRQGRMRSLLNSQAFNAEFRAIVRRTDATVCPDPSVPVQNVWLGVSAENQRWADVRVPALLETPAAVRFVSAEPLLGSIDLGFQRKVPYCTCAGTAPGYPQHEQGCGWEPGNEGIDWVIVGGESGPGARPMLQPWVRHLRDQCEGAGVAFFFKQWGEWAPTTRLGAGVLDDSREHHGEVVEDGKFTQVEWRRIYRRIGKKAAGSLLDGQEHKAWPEVTAWRP